MSISNGFNSADKKNEDDYEDGIAFADAVGKLSEQYEKDLIEGKSIWSNFVPWDAAEMVDESDLCSKKMFKAIMTGDKELIDTLRDQIRDFINTLAEDHIENQEQDDD